MIWTSLALIQHLIQQLSGGSYEVSVKEVSVSVTGPTRFSNVDIIVAAWELNKFEHEQAVE